MRGGLDNPFAVLAVSLVALWLAAQIGWLFHKFGRALGEDERGDFDTLQAAALTLLGLVIGFTFSMAVSRYDQRKNLEAAEANAIGTEYLRADLLPPDNAQTVRTLLRRYADLRISYYETSGENQLARINGDTTKLQGELWSAVLPAAAKQPTPVVTLAISGMNDVLNSQGYTQAAWWNRIPIAAWEMMGLIAIACNLLVGYGAHRRSVFLLLILPIIVSLAFFLIADIDSPQGGIIRVLPQNLIAQAQSMKAN
ncbi:MAG TPA: hypothetical protein VLX09_25945 [Stellaceae bacterium]|nr:hypothetical protein [Stellaceae bacterium]